MFRAERAKRPRRNAPSDRPAIPDGGVSLSHERAGGLGSAQRVALRNEIRDAAVAEVFDAFPSDDGKRRIANERSFRAEQLPGLELALELDQLGLDHGFVDDGSV